MSFENDCFEDLLREKAILLKSLDIYSSRYSSNKVLWDAIESFRDEKIDETIELECLARDIMKTISRIKSMSEKQKKVLIRLLINRNEQGYQIVS